VRLLKPQTKKTKLTKNRIQMKWHDNKTKKKEISKTKIQLSKKTIPIAKKNKAEQSNPRWIIL
jgi:putative cell wall-binding protein